MSETSVKPATGGKATYKLTYFDAKGRGELPRLLFSAAGVPFEDVRIKSEDWPKLKGTTPQGTLPFLEDDGFVICQSMAIVRHLARKFGLYGNGFINQAKTDMFLETTVDLRTAILAATFLGTEEQKAAGRKAFDEKHLPHFFKTMEKAASENKAGYLVGDRLTVADLAVFDVLETVIIENPDALNKFPALKANRTMVAETKSIKEYLAKHP